MTQSDQNWRSTLLAATATIREVIARIDKTGYQIALVVSEDGTLKGTITDGDVRRGILRGIALDRPVTDIMAASPTVVTADTSRTEALSRMNELQIHHLPVVDAHSRVVGLYRLGELLTPAPRANMVVLMAGGLGKRLSPLTDSCPKPMLRIGGQPILESILKNCIDHGFHRFFIAVNHCAEQVEDYFGDGSQWKISIEYLREERLLGTAGALGLLPQLPSEPLVVMNGDVLTKINLDSLLKFHEEQTSDATMCIREYEYHVPFGVIALNGHEILRIEEKPVQRFFVNAGVYVLSPQAVQLVRPGQRIHMTELFEAAVNRSYSTAVFPVHEYWIDVGQHAQFEQAERDFRGAFRGD